MEVNFKFDAIADLDDVMKYTDLMDDNSCIAYGLPTVNDITKDAEETNVSEMDIGEDVSGSSAFVTSATFVLAGAMTMLLA